MSITINQCAKCGHEWPQSTGVPPRRCPAAGCRTVKWNPAPILEPEQVDKIRRKRKHPAKDLSQTVGSKRYPK